MAEKRKYTKRSEYWTKNNSAISSDKKEVTKVGNTGLTTARLSLTELGTSALNTIKGFVNHMKPIELRYPHNLATYTEMEDDADIAEALEATYVFVDRAFQDFSISFNKDSEESKKAADYVDWCLRNMEGQTLRQAIRSAITYKKYGFSILEKVYTKVTDGTEYNGFYKLKRLGYRPPETLKLGEPFIFSSDGREILACVQNIDNKVSYGYVNINTSTLGEKVIPRNKFLLFAHNATESNPMGVSPFNAIYTPWKEKKLLSEYEVIGVSKDMGGMPVLEVPSDILNMASADKNSDEARSLDILKSNMANMHAGEQAYMIMPSDIQDNSGVKAYSLTFKGIEGGGKQFDTSALIDRRKKEIFDRFGAGFLIMGNDNVGSYSLSDNKQTLHSHYIERDVGLITEIINVDLIPQLLALNGFKLTDVDMPKLRSQDISDPDIESNSKMLQRIIAVGGLPVTAEVQNEIYEKLGFDYRLPDEILSDQDKFLEWKTTYGSENTSRSGDGLAVGTTGNGTSTTVATNDTSTLNTENAS